MTYEGWANYHTWNVSLWIANNYDLYQRAHKYAQSVKDDENEGKYRHFIGFVLPADYGDVTPDGVSYTDPTLDIEELDEFIAELAE